MSARYTVDSMEGGLRNLRDLINVVCELRFDPPGGDDDNSRVDSLLWIARDLVDGLVERNEQPARITGGQRNG
jgi:hypothetical protein